MPIAAPPVKVPDTAPGPVERPSFQPIGTLTMPSSTKAGARDYGRMFLVLSHVAALSFVLIALDTGDWIADQYGVIGTTLGVLAIIVMFTLRNSDEWIASLWTAAANAGFVVAIAWLMILPFAEDFYDGLTGNDSGQDLPADLASLVSLGAFLAALYLKRIRGH